MIAVTLCGFAGFGGRYLGSWKMRLGAQETRGYPSRDLGSEAYGLFDFAAKHGQNGNGFIEVHHVQSYCH